MGSVVTEAERALIEELLGQHKPEVVAQIVGRGVRTIYYINAELQRRPIKKTFYERIMELVRGDSYEKNSTTSVRTQRGDRI